MPHEFCVLENCSTNSLLFKPRNCHLHRFPPDYLFRAKWEQWVRNVGGPALVNFRATKLSHVLCDKHFRPSDYIVPSKRNPDRRKLSFKAVPSVPPESSEVFIEIFKASPGLPAESSSHEPGLKISNVCSLSVPGSSASKPAVVPRVRLVTPSPSQSTETAVTGVLIPVNILPQSSPNEALTRAVESIMLPDETSSEKLEYCVEIECETTKPTCDNISFNALSPFGEPFGGQEETTATTSPSSASTLPFLATTLPASVTTLPFSDTTLPASATTLPFSDTTLSSDALLPSSLLQSNPRKKTQVYGKTNRAHLRYNRKSLLSGLQAKDFECPMKIHKYFGAASSEFRQTERAYRALKLKCERAAIKIQVLEDRIIQLEKEPQDEAGGLVQLKVCSNCKEVNFCRSNF